MGSFVKFENAYKYKKLKKKNSHHAVNRTRVNRSATRCCSHYTKVATPQLLLINFLYPIVPHDTHKRQNL